MKKIKLYAVSTCYHCNTLKKMLEKKSFAFDYVEVDLLAGKQRGDMLGACQRIGIFSQIEAF